MEEVIATLKHIKFSGDNGFIIAVFEDDKSHHDFNALGNIVNAQLGLQYLLKGEHGNHPKFGRQFKFSTFETQLPMDKEGIFKYLVRICRWIGPSIGSQMVDKYGEKTIEVLKTSPEKVCAEVVGISMARAQEIQSNLLENEINEKAMVSLEFLLNIPHMRKNIVTEIIKEYGANAPEIIKQNPYVLARFRGVSFVLADKVALTRVGYNPQGMERKKSALIYIVSEVIESGSTWVTEKELLQKVDELIGIKNVFEALIELENEDILLNDGADWTLKKIYEEEIYISRKIIEMFML